MKSMTGYGSSQAKTREVEVEAHVKSVNGRFLDVRFHLPKEYAVFETDLRKIFHDWNRGTVDVYVHRRLAVEARLQTVSLRQQNARYWVKELRALAKGLGVKEDLTLRDVLQMPFVIEQGERVGLLPGEVELVSKLVRAAMKKCTVFRAREGAGLRQDLLKQIRFLEQKVKAMAGWREEALKNAHQRLKSRLAALETDGLDASRLALESALLIDKMDVHEEVIRLQEHVKTCRGLIRSGEARGKKLDFYCQELLREVNTIGSKSQLASLTQVVVDAKSIIEKFREQVQNVE